MFQKFKLKNMGMGLFSRFRPFSVFFIRHATETSLRLSAAATPTPAFDLVPFKGVFSSVLKQMDLWRAILKAPSVAKNEYIWHAAAYLAPTTTRHPCWATPGSKRSKCDYVTSYYLDVDGGHS